MAISIDSTQTQLSVTPADRRQQAERVAQERREQEALELQRQQTQAQQREREEENRIAAQERNARTIDVIV